MEAQQALADLTEISSQIEAAVVFDDKGKVVGSTLEDGEGFAKAAPPATAASLSSARERPRSPRRRHPRRQSALSSTT
jgi:hypothetical protein